jgi:DNA-binding response OmpR family regulator
MLTWRRSSAVRRRRSLQVMTATLSKNEVEAMVRALSVLVIDGSQFMRKIVRNCLLNVGVKEVYEAGDGIAGLEAIRAIVPDVVILDWELPLLNGAELARIVRSPGVFPTPNVPIIMLTSHGERWRVIEASRIGINEYLVKPVSAKALYDRLVSIVAKPRRIVQVGAYYGPEPRRPIDEPPGEPSTADTVLI